MSIYAVLDYNGIKSWSRHQVNIDEKIHYKHLASKLMIEGTILAINNHSCDVKISLLESISEECGNIGISQISHKFAKYNVTLTKDIPIKILLPTSNQTESQSLTLLLEHIA